MTTRTEQIPTADGQTFDGYTVLPASGSGPGVLVVQEIFGVNEYIRDVCRRIAELGYVAMAPDMYWRQERNVRIDPGPDAMQQAYGFMSGFDWDQGTADLVSALAHLRGLPETGGKAGAIGFCFGGGLVFRLACAATPDVVVSYYGSAVPGFLSMGDAVTAPILFHFGAKDDFIPREALDAVKAWATPRANCDFREYASGHAFDNNFSDVFSDPPAAAQAWPVTAAFLAQHLGS